ncbi:hypothetical protein JXA12_00830 [Candidatus Woesearchaeota archaeon]|nr:hypothetical protein [Candidatus Woesearchaeota archaeon]
MLLCAVCGRPATISLSYTSRSYCDEHFWRLIERRVRKDLRIHAAIDIMKEYRFRDDGSPLADLARTFLERIFGGRLALVVDPEAAPGPDVILPVCLEEEASARFLRFLDPSLPELSGIRPLRTVSMEDVRHLLPRVALRVSAHPLLEGLRAVEPTVFFGVMSVLEKET